jgi:putative nucleotidyltransferase with HDIG domain
MQHAVDKGWPLDLRLAGLFHDISKPETRKWSPEKRDWTFHGHDVVGGRVAAQALTDLKYPKKKVEKISKLVRWHMFFSDPEKITLSAVRRLMRNVGQENVWDLMNLRMCDRIGTGRPKEQPYRFRKYKSMIEEVMRDPISVSMLAVDGSELMETLSLQPGPKIGHLLHALLEDVLEDPMRNTKTYLLDRAKNIASLSDKDLKALGDQGKERKEAIEEQEIRKIRQKYWVK